MKRGFCTFSKEKRKEKEKKREREKEREVMDFKMFCLLNSGWPSVFMIFFFWPFFSLALLVNSAPSNKKSVNVFRIKKFCFKWLFEFYVR